ncbi:DUF6232 family protein [Pendulispora brunnea]|uniref:DUF6232 family protein n=1 Tax=Pendulispora brunnea TaxID=2905690 RepID=UPI00374E0241
MPLIFCPDCAAQVSDAAPACPRCGRPHEGAKTQHVPLQASNERILFQDRSVTVTNLRLVVGKDTTYAMSNITSVRELVQPRPTIALFAGLVMTVLGTSRCNQAENADSGMIWMWIALLGILPLYVYVRTKPKYWVRVGTAGAETNAISSEDPRWTRTVVDSINAAIVSRG